MYEATAVIYADILFLINFSLDYLCLFIAGRVQSRSQRALRLVGASLFGGAYAFLPYIFAMPMLISLPLHIAAATVICLIAYGRSGIKRFVITVLTFIITSALLGGLITAIYSLTSGYSQGAYREPDALSFCIICLLSAGIALSYGLICRKRINTRSAEIKITLGSTALSLRLLCDSGSLVTEPFSALPVIVVTSSSLPPPYDMPESEFFPEPIRIIPFSTSSGSGCFLGFRPQKIEIVRHGLKPKAIEAYIGIDTERKSYSGYDGLLPTTVL